MADSYFFVGIGGSGMLPLAELLLARGAAVAGSDRARDQGRTPDKFAALAATGAELHPQDGSGPRPGQTLVASAAIESSVPDIAAGARLGLPRLTRAELLARLMNAAAVSVAVGGTSGKSTVTGMIGWILDRAGQEPTIVNGAVMRNYGGASRLGRSEVMVSEVDESDGSIALYRPTVGIVTNIALDHKPLAELRALFAGFLAASRRTAINVDDPELRALAPPRTVTFGTRAGARLRATDLAETELGAAFTLGGRRVQLQVPGGHNVSNALAALAAALALDLDLDRALDALESYTGTARRLERVGAAGGVSVVDDFAHNPDKVRASLDALRAFSGRLLILFQPHGYGPLKVMGRELAQSFAAGLAPGDRVLVTDPAYFGGTTDRSIGADALARWIGPAAEHVPDRAAATERLLALAGRGDRLVVMGARDDTLAELARGLLARLASTAPPGPA